MTIEYMMKNNQNVVSVSESYTTSSVNQTAISASNLNQVKSSSDAKPRSDPKNTTSILFDEVCKIRVLDPSMFDVSEKLKDECQDFLSKMNALNEIVQTIIGSMQDQAQIVEDEKCKAVGLRNLIIKEKEARNRQQKSLQLQIKFFQSEVDKIMTQLESLSKVELEQQSMMDALMGK